MTTLPPNYLRLSSKWLETNVAPEDLMCYYVYDDQWQPSGNRGKLVTKFDCKQYTYATARTDLPREAYADSEPGDEVTSERAEEKCPYCGDDPVDCLACIERDRRQANETIATLRAQLDAKDAECQRLKDDLSTAIDDGNRSRQIIYAMAEALKPETGEHNIDCAKRVATERDKLRAEVEHRAKQRDEFQNLFIEASEAFNERGRQIARLTAELDAARKERDEAKEEFRKAAEWNRLTELELTNLRRLNADLDEDLAALRAEVEAFTKHVGGPTFKDSVDVLLRTKSQDEDKIAEMFDIIKRTGVERDGALAAKDTAERERDRMRDVKWEGILAIEQQRDAAEKIVTEAQSFLTAALTEQITHAEHWVNHYSADPLGKSDRAHWDGKARAFTACLDLITSALTPAPTQEPPAGGVTISTAE